MPIFSILYKIIIIGNMGIPLTINFIGEYLSYLSAIEVNLLITLIGTLSIIINGGYSVYIYNKKIMGFSSLKKKNIKDIKRKEYIHLLPILILIFILGILPNLIINFIENEIFSYLFIIKLNI